ncbi:IS3 family transposase [Burkholderia sp. AU31652]|uniref:IS3-like element ISBam1 family transposase n=1 Tax=Burkholderia TaxID=32008 RepID=UPI000B7A6FFE|nr:MULTISPECIES: IS3-like element ISBam1 family transposase [Burkholderia]OXI87005.1 IS3 family transposase [Burkholderia sp. AU31652]OXI87439.1 IS3 family transposase [Burkholderia sp. AU31652]OXI91148.1 IS3 family transposase [Burkholderia sp. AU31652]OXJ12229.1 IS3 family transposase [Burkholderia sp. HI2500]OXJ17428.1 IS3 family transposase [Burkholderia sp. HI2500]
MSKYTEQFKVSIAEEYESGHAGFREMSKRHGVDEATIRKWVAAHRIHGPAGLKKKCERYSAEFKLLVLQQMRSEGLSARETAARFNIRNRTAIGQWKRQYDEGGIDALSPRQRGRPRKMPKPPLTPPPLPEDDTRSRQELLDELNFLRMENAYFKKARSLGSSAAAISATQKAQIVLELRQQYPLAGLLKVAGLARSTFYYHQKLLGAADKYADTRARICSLFERHKGRYGYRRITLALRNLGQVINHKTVARLMGELRLKSCVRPKKYRSYKGSVGRVAPHVLQRRFYAKRPNEKWVTDVTEFNVGGQKLYLSPVLDLYNGEIIAYETARRPAFEMVSAMLRKALARLKSHERPLLHSDQGWQYQMPAYRRLLQQRALTQSMSRKGNCLDNAAMESFFGTLKSEFFHLNRFRNLDELQTGLASYIHYYNHDRIKLKLKGLSPVQYRTQPSQP